MTVADERLADIQEQLIAPAIEKKIDTDVIIKIRRGKIVWSESKPTKKKTIAFFDLL